MTLKEPPACTINNLEDGSIIPTNLIIDIPAATQNIDGNTLNNMWAANPKYKDNWLVLRTATGGVPFTKGSGRFNKKAIIINRSAGHSSGSLPDVDVAAKGNILFYIPPATNTVVSYGQISGSFRGMFYNASPNTEVNLSATSAGWTVNGAFYNAGKITDNTSAVIQLGTGANGRITINYDEEALNELSELGIITMDDESTEDRKLAAIPESVNSLGIRTKLLSRSF